MVLELYIVYNKYMNNKWISNFFRKDLNLKDKWWHRLFSVIFIISFIVFLIYNIFYVVTNDIFKGDGVQEWEVVSSLSKRITSEVHPISYLIEPGEKVAEQDRLYVLNDNPDEIYKWVLNDTYCSNKLYNDFVKVKTDRGIDALYIRDLYGKNDVSENLFSEYIKNNNIKCLIIDAYSYSNNMQVSFLEPDKSYQDNWAFYEKSTFKTVIYFAKAIFYALIYCLIIFTVILIIYYKIIIYIIFGSKKNV